jgi:hypothetical protein
MVYTINAAEGHFASVCGDVSELCPACVEMEM